MASPMFYGPDPATRPPKFDVPAGACDSHAHIIGPHAKYRLSGREGATPPEALLSEYFLMLDTLGIERGVMVQPSAYSIDNTLMLDAIASAPDRLRGIAILDFERMTNVELNDLHGKGVRGLRFNTRGSSPTSAGNAPPLPVDKVLKLGKQLADCNMHAQFLVLVDQFHDIDKAFADFPVNVVIDHMGYVDPRNGLNGAGFNTLLRWLETGRCWVKLSAPYRFSNDDIPYSDMAPFARRLVEVNPDRIVWATDWPHSAAFPPDQNPKRTMPNDGLLLDLLAEWVPDTGIRKKILVDNPASLYGFK